MQGDEIRALRRLQREQGASPHVFSSERGGPLTPKSFHTLFARIGLRAKMPFPIHPHMLRHACGYALANAGHDTRALQAYLGHKNIQHTVSRVKMPNSDQKKRMCAEPAALSVYAVHRPLAGGAFMISRAISAYWPARCSDYV